MKKSPLDTIAYDLLSQDKDRATRLNAIPKPAVTPSLIKYFTAVELLKPICDIDIGVIASLSASPHSTEDNLRSFYRLSQKRLGEFKEICPTQDEDYYHAISDALAYNDNTPNDVLMGLSNSLNIVSSSKAVNVLHKREREEREKEDREKEDRVSHKHNRPA